MSEKARFKVANMPMSVEPETLPLYCSFPGCESKFTPNKFPAWNTHFCCEQCSKYEKRMREPETYLKACGVPARYQKCSFENFRTDAGSEKAFRALRGLRTLEGSVYLGGDVGAGKTHLSVATIKSVSVSQPCRASFQSATGILLDLRACFSQDGVSERDALKKYQTEDILVVDDLGAEKLTDYVVQAWYSIIDFRYSNCLPTIFTSNLSMGEVAQRFGDRVASRICSGIVLTVKGKDRRLS